MGIPLNGGEIPQGQLSHKDDRSHAELSILKDNSNLIVNGTYKMSYFTRHEFVSDPQVIHTSGINDVLTLTAISSNEFSSDVKSDLYPSHEIKYDFDKIVCGDTAQTPRPGIITERYDPYNQIRCKFDFIGCKVRLFEITGKEYVSVTKFNDTTVVATIAGNRPNIITSNQITYEFSFATMTHPEGQMTIDITYNNEVSTRKLLYYLDQTPDGVIPANYLSDKKGTAVYNPELDAFVFMGFRDVGSELIGTFSSPIRDNFSIGRGNIKYIVDTSSYQDFSVFTGSNIFQVNIPGGAFGDVRPDVVFKGDARWININESLTRTVFTKNINGFSVGRNVDKLLCDSQETNHVTKTYINDVLLLNSGFSFYYIDHRYQSLSRSVITPCANMYMEAIDLCTIIFEKSGAFTSTAPIQLSNIFVTGLNIGSTPNAFKISNTVLRCLIGYFDARNLLISKTLVDQTLFERDLSIVQIEGATLLDSLQFKNTPAVGAGTKTLLAYDEDLKVVQGGDVDLTMTLVDDPDTMAPLTTGLYNNFEETAPDDLPIDNRGTALVLLSDSAGMQLWANAQTNQLYLRTNTGVLGSLTYSNWDRLLNIDDVETATTIIAKLSAVAVEGDKLPNSAIQVFPVNLDVFVFDGISGEMDIDTDAEPTENSVKFVNSGDLFTYLENFQTTASFLPTFVKTDDTNNESFRKMKFRNSAFYSCVTSGASTRLYISKDGRFFLPAGTTGNGQFYDFDVSETGTIILVDRTNSSDGIERSVNGGATFTTIDVTPLVLELTGIVSMGGGRWVACCRLGEIIYSVDDGVSWASSTVTGTYTFQGLCFADGLILAASDTGIDRMHVSTDFGVTFTAYNHGTDKLFRDVEKFDGRLVVSRAGQFATGYLSVSDDGGATWTNKLVPVNSSQQLSGISVIGDYLYLYGAGGFIMRTNDLETTEVITSGTTNTVSCMALGQVNQIPVIMYGCDTGTNDRVFSTQI